MIKTGHAGQVYTDTAVRHVLMRQGVIGIRVAIMLPHDPKGQQGPKIPLDDVVVILEPKEEVSPATLLAQQAAQQQVAAAAAAQQSQQPFLSPPAGTAAAGFEMGGPLPAEPAPAAPMEDPNVAAGF